MHPLKDILHNGHLIDTFQGWGSGHAQRAFALSVGTDSFRGLSLCHLDFSAATSGNPDFVAWFQLWPLATLPNKNLLWGSLLHSLP